MASVRGRGNDSESECGTEVRKTTAVPSTAWVTIMVGQEAFTHRVNEHGHYHVYVDEVEFSMQHGGTQWSTPCGPEERAQLRRELDRTVCALHCATSMLQARAQGGPTAAAARGEATVPSTGADVTCKPAPRGHELPCVVAALSQRQHHLTRYIHTTTGEPPLG